VETVSETSGISLCPSNLATSPLPDKLLLPPATTRIATPLSLTLPPSLIPRASMLQLSLPIASWLEVAPWMTTMTVKSRPRQRRKRPAVDLAQLRHPQALPEASDAILASGPRACRSSE
jgi:hypothetical protein